MGRVGFLNEKFGKHLFFVKFWALKKNYLELLFTVLLILFKAKPIKITYFYVNRYKLTSFILKIMNKM